MWKCKEWWNIQLTLAIWCRPLSQHLLPPARHQPHFLIPSAQTINDKKAKNPEMRFNSHQIVLYCLGLRTQNPGLREVDLEPSQTDNPMVPFLYHDLMKLVKKIMLLIFMPDVKNTCTTVSAIRKIDFDDKDNFLKVKDISQGFAADKMPIRFAEKRFYMQTTYC